MGAEGTNFTVTRGDCSLVGELLPSTREFLGSECKRGWGGGCGLEACFQLTSKATVAHSWLPSCTERYSFLILGQHLKGLLSRHLAKPGNERAG